VSVERGGIGKHERAQAVAKRDPGARTRGQAELGQEEIEQRAQEGRGKGVGEHVGDLEGTQAHQCEAVCGQADDRLHEQVHRHRDEAGADQLVAVEMAAVVGHVTGGAMEGVNCQSMLFGQGKDLGVAGVHVPVPAE